jgi:hypothetical protein
MHNSIHDFQERDQASKYENTKSDFTMGKSIPTYIDSCPLVARTNPESFSKSKHLSFAESLANKF